MKQIIIISSKNNGNDYSIVKLLSLEGGIINYYVLKIGNIVDGSSRHGEVNLEYLKVLRPKYILHKGRASTVLPAGVVTSALKQGWSYQTPI
jgi:hypothetical protein